MNGYLIDTNVLSEYNRPGGPDPGVKHSLETTDRQTQFVSVMTLAEIEKGIELLAEGRRRAQLETWLSQDFEGGFLAAYFRLIDRPPPDGWRSVRERDGHCPQSIH